MTMPDLTELGFGLGSLALIWVVVKYFIATVEKKDKQIARMIKSFNKTINNHIKHQAEEGKKNTIVLKKLDKSITLLLKKLEK